MLLQTVAEQQYSYYGVRLCSTVPITISQNSTIYVVYYYRPLQKSIRAHGSLRLEARSANLRFQIFRHVIIVSLERPAMHKRDLLHCM